MTPLNNVNLDEDHEWLLNRLLAEVSVQPQSPLSGASLVGTALAKLGSWRLPFEALLVAVLSALPNDKRIAYIQKSHGSQSKLGIELIRNSGWIASLTTDPTSVTQTYTARKSCRWDRLRNIYAAAYTEPYLALVCLAFHLARLEAVKTTMSLTSKEARRIARDTEIIFIPLMEMLGLWNLAKECGKLCISWLETTPSFDNITSAIEEANNKRNGLCSTVQSLVRSNIEEQVEATLRENHPYTVYRWVLRGESLEYLTRRVRMDVVVERDEHESIDRIARTLFRHMQNLDEWVVVESKDSDMISAPKLNGYRARQLSFVCHPYGRVKGQMDETLVKIHIMTKDMRDINHEGIIAALFSERPQHLGGRVWWENQSLQELVRSRLTPDNGTALPATENEVFVYSPMGGVYRLPFGSVPVDYAYCIHHNVGSHARRFWVNGVISKSDSPLKDGDIIEVEVDPDYFPPLETWQDKVKTPIAYEGIRRALRRRTRRQGQNLIQKAVRHQMELHLIRDIPNESLNRHLRDVAVYYGYFNVNGLYQDFGTSTRREKVNLPSLLEVASRVVALRMGRHLLMPGKQPVPVDHARIRLHRCACDSSLHGRILPGQPVCLGFLPAEVNENEIDGVLFSPECLDAQRRDDLIPLEWRFDDSGEQFRRIEIECDDYPHLLETILASVYSQYSRGLYLLKIRAAVAGIARTSAKVQMEVAGPIEAIEALEADLTAKEQMGLIDFLDSEQFTDAQHLAQTRELGLLTGERSKNPYVLQGANREVFQGRQDELRQMEEWLRNRESEGNARVVYGIERIGKTSFLQRLYSMCLETPNLQALPVFVDLQALSAFDDSAFWRLLARTTAGTVGVDESENVSLTNYEEFRSWLSRVVLPHCGERRLLLILDELNFLEEMRDRQAAKNVVLNLRALLADRTLGNGRSILVVASIQKHIYDLALAQSHTSVLATLESVMSQQSIFLRHLERPAARKLATLCYHVDRLPLETILDLSGSHPYYVTLLANEMVGVGPSAKYRQEKDISKAAKAIAAKDNYFHYFLTFVSRHPDRLAIVQALAEITHARTWGATVSEISQKLHQFNYEHLYSVLDDLVAGCILNASEAPPTEYNFSVPLFRDHLLRNRHLAGEGQ